VLEDYGETTTNIHLEYHAKSKRWKSIAPTTPLSCYLPSPMQVIKRHTRNEFGVLCGFNLMVGMFNMSRKGEWTSIIPEFGITSPLQKSSFLLGVKVRTPLPSPRFGSLFKCEY
jgi:hypothetical protein